MQRCVALARLGAGSTAPNPMVGALLLHNDRIIGEGYHQQYGQAHAEVNCIRSVAEEEQLLLSSATLYVSLEPCAHFGKTPPCADLIIEKKIPRVVVGCRDPFTEVNGKGIEKLKAAGIEVTVGVLESECQLLNKRFFTFHQKQRPYIILKWAQTSNGIIGNSEETRLLVSNHYSNRLAHQWRSEEAAVLVGTQTALQDNPALSNRLWSGAQPLRAVVDMDLRLPASLQLFDGSLPTVVFNRRKNEAVHPIQYCRCDGNAALPQQICRHFYQMNIQSALVEGGARLQQSFIDEGLFDEVRIITNTGLRADGGVQAARAGKLRLIDTVRLKSDIIQYYQPAL